MNIKDEIKKLEEVVKDIPADEVQGIDSTWLVDALKIINKLMEVVEIQQEYLETLTLEHYPTNIFLPLTDKQFAQIAKNCEEHDFPIDRLSAHYGRHHNERNMQDVAVILEKSKQLLKGK